MNTGKRAIFIDRDGVINDCVDRGDNCFVQGKPVRWTAPWTYREFKLKNNVQAALEALGRLGFLRILITNQPDISYGLMEKDEHELIMSDIKKLPLDDIFVCLHGRDDGCECKKPKPGMFKQAADKHNVDFKRSYAIGDRSNDLEPAHNLGCKTILLTSEQSQNVTADFTASDLLEGVAIIKNDYENFY